MNSFHGMMEKGNKLNNVNVASVGVHFIPASCFYSIVRAAAHIKNSTYKTSKRDYNLKHL